MPRLFGKGLERYKKTNFLTPEFARKQVKQFKKLIKRSNETDEEKQLYEKYVEIVQESFKNDNVHQKFSLSHIFELGIEWDILFLYSKKDVGKTYQVGLYVGELLRTYPNAQIMFIRNTKEEGTGFKETMNNGDNGPTGTNGEYVYKKNEVIKSKGSVSRLKPCGFFAYCSGAGFTRGQGGEFKDVRFGYWDECNSHLKNGLDFTVFQRFDALLSSVIRDKTYVKGIMTGNLLYKSNIFLERLGVGSKTNLKILDIYKDNNPKKDRLSRMLYLNTGSLFKGIESQKGLATQFLTDNERNNLLYNRPGAFDDKAVYEAIHLKKLLPLRAFVFREEEPSSEFTTKRTDYVVYAYSVPYSKRVVIGIDIFDVNKVKPGFSRIYCQDSLISNDYYLVTPYPDAEKEAFAQRFILPIEIKLLQGEIGFGGNLSKEIFEKNWPILKSKYLNNVI